MASTGSYYGGPLLGDGEDGSASHEETHEETHDDSHGGHRGDALADTLWYHYTNTFVSLAMLPLSLSILALYARHFASVLPTVARGGADSAFTMARLTLMLHVVYASFVAGTALVAAAQLDHEMLPLGCNGAVRAMVALYALGKGLFYVVCVMRVRMTYKGSTYQYRRKILNALLVFVIVWTMLFFAGSFLVPHPAHGHHRGGGHSNEHGKGQHFWQCRVHAPLWGKLVFSAVDSLIILVTLAMFVRPLKHLRRQITRSNSIGGVDREDPVGSVSPFSPGVSPEPPFARPPPVQGRVTELSLKPPRESAMGARLSMDPQGVSASEEEDEKVSPVSVAGGALPPAVIPRQLTHSVSRTITFTRTLTAADLERRGQLKSLAVKFNILTGVALGSALVSVAIIAVLDFFVVGVVDVVINQLCLLLIHKTYDKCYRRLCCLPVRWFDRD